MYEITLNDATLYHPSSVDCIVTNAKLKEALNDSGYLELTIPFSNPCYDDAIERIGKIIIYKDNVPLWYGVIRDVSVDFSKNKKIYVVGEASYLNDSVQEQVQYTDETKYNILTAFINRHNSMAEPFKQFKVGIVGKGANSQMTFATDWEYTLDAIREHLCGDEEYFRIRHVNGERYIDIMPIDNYGKTSEQTILFGDNLLDYAEESSGSDIATVCIPLGVRLEESAIEGIEQYLTCESANNGKNYVELPVAIQRLGYITKVVHFNVLDNAQDILTAGTNYLKEAQYAKLTLNLTAVDLSILHSDIDDYDVGDYVHAICEPMGMDAVFPVREKETDLLDLANNKIKIGATGVKSMTAQQAEKIDDLEKLMPSKDAILNQAKKNVSEMINANADNGHVVFKQNQNGVISEILIMDTSDINTAQKMWRWNEGGFGFRKRDASGNWENYDVAMTMDGQIVADFITTGTMSASQVRGGDFEVGGNGYAQGGSITVKNATGNEIVKINDQGIDMDSGSISLGGKFSVDSNGNLVATGANISGTINSTSGNIGGFTINNNSLGVGDSLLSANVVACGSGGNGCARLVGNAGGAFIDIANALNQSGGTYTSQYGIRINHDGLVQHFDGYGNVDWTKHLASLSW